ncbi:hypothetical protein HanIR_Chr03g0107321 [Helianthus annuus]|nr:hypothetical protein HanIR_Chr03g0107321 [Helianthus annuus]
MTQDGNLFQIAANAVISRRGVMPPAMSQSKSYSGMIYLGIAPENTMPAKADL